MAIAGLQTVSVEEELNVLPSRAWAAFRDAKTLLPRACPDLIESIEYLEGDGGSGSMRLVKFRLAPGVTSAAKERLDLMDDDTRTMIYTIVEVDWFRHYVGTLSFKAGTNPSSGTTAIWKVEYVPIGDNPRPDRRLFVGLLKAVESYLLENPDMYLAAA